MCRTFGLTTRRWTNLIGWLDGPPQLRDVTMCKDVTEKWAKRLYRGWAGETTMETERGHAGDWQNSRSLIALDLDTPAGRQMAERARDIMTTRDGPGWDGIVVALLVAKEPRSIKMITDDGAYQTVTLLRIPPGRLPLRKVTASYDEVAAPYTRTTGKEGAC